MKFRCCEKLTVVHISELQFKSMGIYSVAITQDGWIFQEDAILITMWSNHLKMMKNISN